MRKEQTMSEQPHDTEPVTIVLATRNQGKVRELAEPLRAFGLRVVGLDAFPDLPEVEETGTTFEENALLKAREVSKRTGLVAIADDSGLEVDALNGAPGVYSARYSEDMPDLPGATKDERNTMKLLAALSSCGCGTVRRASAPSSPSVRPKAKPSSLPAHGKAASPAPRAAKTASATIPFSSIPSWASPPPKCPRKKK